MAILDCENYNSTIISICNIYNINKDDIVKNLARKEAWKCL